MRYGIFVLSFIRSLVHCFIRSFVRSIVPSFVRLVVYLFVYVGVFVFVCLLFSVLAHGRNNIESGSSHTPGELLIEL